MNSHRSAPECPNGSATKVQPRDTARTLGGFELFARQDDPDRRLGGGVVYGLVGTHDPERIRYVGKTINPDARFRGHCSGVVAHAVGLEGGVLAMVILERSADATALINDERRWIQRAVRFGMADFNLANTRNIADDDEAEADADPLFYRKAVAFSPEQQAGR